MSGTYPTLPGRDIRVVREQVYSTRVQTADSGKELRIKRQTSPRYRYVLSYNFLRLSANEAQDLAAHHTANSGSYDTFTFTDPYDGSSKTVRFVEDNLRFERVVDQVWACGTVELISVL